MNFKRIETIFIVAFIILNIFLFNSLVDRRNLHYVSTTADQIDLLEDMRQANIQLPTFDDQNQQAYAIQANNYDILEEEASQLEGQVGIVEEGLYYTSFLSNPIELEGSVEEGFTQADYDKLANFLRSPQVLFGEEYALGKLDKENGVFIYYHVVNGIPIMDGTSQIIFYIDTDNNVFSYHQLYIGETMQQGNPIQTISDLDAVKSAYQNNEISANTLVKKPVLAYQRTLYLDDLSMYVPVWTIEVEHSTRGKVLLQVDATDGTVIQQSAQANQSITPLPERPEADKH